MPCERLPFGTHGTITLTKTKAGTWQASTYYKGLTGCVAVCAGLLRLPLVWRLLSVSSMLRTSPILSI